MALIGTSILTHLPVLARTVLANSNQPHNWSARSSWFVNELTELDRSKKIIWRQAEIVLD